MSMDDHILSAIRDFEYLLSSLEEKEKSEVGESFRSRSRELPSLIEDVGFVAAMCFCYAKASKTIYMDVKKALESNNKIDDNNPTQKGYGIYLYFVLKKLKDLKLINEVQLEPIEALKELMNGKQKVASKLLRPYMIQMKNLSEAVFKEDEGG